MFAVQQQPACAVCHDREDTYLVKLRKNVQVFFCFSIIAYDIIFHVFITVLKAYIGLFFLKSANSLKLN